MWQIYFLLTESIKDYEAWINFQELEMLREKSPVRVKIPQAASKYAVPPKNFKIKQEIWRQNKQC